MGNYGYIHGYNHGNNNGYNESHIPWNIPSLVNWKPFCEVDPPCYQWGSPEIPMISPSIPI